MGCEALIEEEPDSNDTADDQENQFGGRATRKSGETGQVMDLVFNGIEGEVPEAVVVGKGKLNVVSFGPLNHGRDRSFGDLGQGADGLVDEMAEAIGQHSQQKEKENHRDPFAAMIKEIQFGERQVSKEGS